jgi:hypothetical protein
MAREIRVKMRSEVLRIIAKKMKKERAVKTGFEDVG